MHVRTIDRRKNSRSFEPPEVLWASIPGARWRGKQGFRAKGKERANRAELANFYFPSPKEGKAKGVDAHTKTD